MRCNLSATKRARLLTSTRCSQASKRKLVADAAACMCLSGSQCATTEMPGHMKCGISIENNSQEDCMPFANMALAAAIRGTSAPSGEVCVSNLTLQYVTQSALAFVPSQTLADCRWMQLSQTTESSSHSM